MKVKTKTFTVIIVVMFTIFFSNYAKSQEMETNENMVDSRGYLMLGGGTLDIDALNERLQTKGYTSFSDEFFTIGAGFTRKHENKWIIGAEGNVYLVEQTDSKIAQGRYTSSLVAGNLLLDFGYAVVSSGGFNLYPLVGVGFGGTWLQIGKNNFDEILDEPVRNAEISSATFLLNFAIGSDYLFKLKEYEKNEGGLVLGFRIGYSYSPFDGTWMSDMISIDNGPSSKITGPYGRITIGFGGKGKWWKDK